MLELGAALGAGTWWCEQLFAVAGAWVPSTDEAAIRRHLAELSRVLGDHALALRRHLPRPTGVDPVSWVAPPSRAAEGVVLALAAPDRSCARLAGVHRVLVPRLLVAWSAHVRGAAVADRGVARTLGHAHHDLLDLWHEGEGLLQALVDADPARASTAGAASARLEADLARSGGIFPGSPAALPG